MPYKFNPFTHNLDYYESGGGGSSAAFFTGEVATFADLPLDGTAALNSRWLVRSNSGTWPFSSYKQAGIYIRTATVGSDRDNDYTLTDTSFHDVMSDDAFLLFDDADATKNLKFQLSGITTGQTRTLTVPNANGTIALNETFAAPPAIGNTTPAAGTFTTLAANNGTLTASAPVLDLAQTWNASGTTFTGLRANFTDTASASGSKALDIQVGGTSVLETSRIGLTTIRRLGASVFTNVLEVRRDSTLLFRVRDDGTVLAEQTSGGIGVGASILLSGGAGLKLRTDFAVGWSSTTFASDASDLELRRDAADALAQRRTTNAQTFRLYNTFTSATNFERLAIGWASNIVSIKPEAGGSGGTVRELHISGLPTSNPGPGILWDDSGTVKVGT